jgi:hypothetical protein
MAVNQKLTSIIKGRVVMTSEADASGVQITFKDSSIMKVKTVGSQPPTIPEGVRVREASEHGAAFVIGCEDDTTIDFTLAEPGNAISVRDETGSVEYLG